MAGPKANVQHKSVRTDKYFKWPDWKTGKKFEKISNVYLFSLLNRLDNSVGRASASRAGGCGFDPWPRHTKDDMKMVQVASLFGDQH